MKISKKIKIVLISITSLALLIGVLFIAYIIIYVTWSFKVNGYCSNKAQALLGASGAKTTPTNDVEKKQFPGMNEISLQFREQLKCEHDPKVLEKFPTTINKFRILF